MTCLNEAALCQANYKSKPHCNANARQVGPDVSRDLILMQDHPGEVVVPKECIWYDVQYHDLFYYNLVVQAQHKRFVTAVPESYPQSVRGV